MNWVADSLGAGAVIYPGFGGKDHTRAAIQLLSGEVPEKKVFTHTGWRILDEEYVFLHAKGAIGPNGPVPDVWVRLPEEFSRYTLPSPWHDPTQSIRASLKLWDVGPDRITIPCHASAFRAALGWAKNSIHVTGTTGGGKTELAALSQQHYGSGLDSSNLPANWSSTGNALESLAFIAKDALLLVDDFVPVGTSYDIGSLHRKGDRVFRAQGNSTGRQRLTAESSLKAQKPPRGLILSTGEEIPQGQSLAARIMILDLGPDDLDWERITQCQQDARAGLYAQAMAGFVCYLALSRDGSQLDEIESHLRHETEELRQQFFRDGMHRRTATLVADLALGTRYFLHYAEEYDVITPEERNSLWERTLQALTEASEAQQSHQADSEPTRRFLDLLRAAIASGRAHVADLDGTAPKPAGAWGWPLGDFGPRAKGGCIGWVDGDDLYLEPEASYNVAQRMARDAGGSLPVGSKTLHKRLHERGLLVTKERDDRLLVRKTVEGGRRAVLHLKATTLLETDQPDQPDQSDGPSALVSALEQ